MSAKSKSKKGKDGVRDTSPEPTPGTSHRSKKRRLSTDDEEESGSPKRASGHSTSKLGHNGLRSPNFTPHNKPAELFRKDLISAMKLADSEPLQQDYIFIADPWRQDWEKGVQVPVNPTEIPHIEIKELFPRPSTGDFKIPRKYLHATQDETFRQGIHELTGMHQLSEQVVRYDLDDLDVTWLQMTNEEREELGLLPIHEWTMERVIEGLESNCHERIKDIMKTEEGLGIEYDEDIVCEVCRSPDSEETNEMVFCDGCDICVHQACYGIQMIPEGRWLCRTCSLGIKPSCILCPKIGGAMKSTKSGTKWAHVSCALWIPEVSIGCVEKMEPITKISNIPASRWALVCCVCKDRVGACIQCSVKTCKTAFHVTCAIFNGLEMKTILDETDDGDGVKLKAFCPRHSKKRDNGQSDSETDSPRKEAPSTPRKENLSKEEVANLRAKRMTDLKGNFYHHVDCQEVATQLSVEEEVVEIIMAFWTLKRVTSFDKPLLMPKTEEADMLEKQQEDSLVARMKMFVHLRQDLERVRNLCYMISRREKTKRQYYKTRETAFMAAVRALTDVKTKLSSREAEKLAKKYTHNSLYDGFDPHFKPSVVNRLSFSEERMVPSPHVADDTESVDSDCRDTSVPFRERLYSQSSLPGDKDVDVTTSKNSPEESLEVKSCKDSESERDSVIELEEIRRDSKLDKKRERVDRRRKEYRDRGGKDSNTSCTEIDVESCELSPDTETIKVEKRLSQERHLGRRSQERHVESSSSERLKEKQLQEKVVERLSPEKDIESLSPDKMIEMSSPDRHVARRGRPKHGSKRKRDRYSSGNKNICEMKADHDSSDLSDKSVKENHETTSGKSEKTIRESDRHVKGGRGKEKRTDSDHVEADSNMNCSIDAGVSSGRERTRGRGKERIKIEPDLESEIVDVILVDPPVLKQDSHPKIETKVKSETVSEKVKEVEERPKRLLRENRQQIEMPKVDMSPTRSPSPEIIKIEDVTPVKEPKKDKHRKHGHRRHKRQHRSAERRRERTLSRERKLSDTVKLEVNGVIRKSSKYVVENSVKERVQNKLLKSRRLRYLNGALDKSQSKIDTFFRSKSDTALTLRQSSRILNEISPDKGKLPFENNLFGAHYTPKGSLSGYKIPKKGDSAEQSPAKSLSSCEKSDKSDTRTRRKGETDVKRDIFSDTGFDVLNTDSDFAKDVELVSDSRGYRSHSPLSSAGTDVSDYARASPSREGTPRRVTRSSQLVDVDENSMDSVNTRSSNMKLRLSDGWMKPAKFSS